ncbi:toll/interleukin-1 receptor domain-containing protein [Actinomycetospora termitidis]|uniref:Toll/interleukin-1 receptor domain-containing protein n=1 Tax=Actinomycetospora termitidis TaxID=3053470 RepID=A0ABT7MEF8_9PSEU|nr:toll/interleukin-1 receptor domain-containing protein [Actinomycetospora sp. Odt1-22]MDL5159048.1 toll/interleukin-1 receptor domain-containing protein [Actinomycetospora sp. Odt1-22]
MSTSATRAPADHGATYAAFVSYSHRADGALAAQLQVGIERFATEARAARTVRVFRDDANLGASPDLWATIEDALARSEWLVVLASPLAARSDWVGRELDWWRTHRSVHRILVVLTDGTLTWSGDDFDPTSSTALHPRLRGVFGAEPRTVDAREMRAGASRRARDDAFQSVLADVTATVRGVEKDTIRGEHLAIQRRAVRRARGAVVALSVLVVLALVAGGIAWYQRGRAVEQTNLAVARQLASTAVSRTGTDLPAAALLAVAAFRNTPNPQTRAALMQTDLASPHLTGVRHLPVPVSSVDGSDDGSTVLVGLVDGRVVRLPFDGGPMSDVLTLPTRVDEIATDSSGQVVVATGGGSTFLARNGRTMPLTVPGSNVTHVAMAPSGRTAVLTLDVPATPQSRTAVVDVASGAARLVVPSMSAAEVTLPNDDEVVVMGLEGWERRRTVDGSVVSSVPLSGFGARLYATAISRDGAAFTHTNDSGVFDVGSTLSGAGEVPVSEATAPVTKADALALSPDGRRTAAAGAGTIYVSDVTASGAAAAAPVALTGIPDVTEGGLEFLGDGSRLVSASGTSIATWDLRQVDRLTRALPTKADWACTACPPPEIAVSPDGARVAVLDGRESVLAVQSLAGGPPAILRSEQMAGGLAWDPGGGLTVHAVRPIPPTPLVAGTLPSTYDDDAVSTRITTDGRAISVVDDGTVVTRDVRSGQVVADVPGPVALGQYDEAVGSVSPDGAHAAVVGDAGAAVVEPATRQVVARLPGDVTSATYAGRVLLVQRADGSLETWTEDGRALLRTLPPDPGYEGAAPVTGDSEELIGRPRLDGSLDVVDLASGVPLASLPAPADGGLKTGHAFTRDARTLLSVTESADEEPTAMLVRDLSDDALVALACRVAGRDLTPTEWTSVTGTDPPDDLSCR